MATKPITLALVLWLVPSLSAFAQETNFTRIDTGAIVNDGGYSNGASWGDYDNDGFLDLFVANDRGQNNFLYRNKGNGTFAKITSGAIVNDGGNSNGSSWGDHDNDGDLDLFVANYFGKNNFLYQNNGDGTFTKITSDAIVNDGGDSVGSSWGDYDNDGDLDLFVANSNNQNNFLYQNNGNGNNWIDIRLLGTVSNTAAIGAKVKVKATIKGKPVWQVQEISGQTGYVSQNSLNAEFGLGDAAMIDSIKIEWPSGILQNTADVAVNQFLTLNENKRPQVANIIPGITLAKDNPKFTQNLNMIFFDPDEDQLLFTAASSDTNIARTAIAKDTLIVSLVSGTARGQAMIDLAATDGVAGEASAAFKVNRPPFINNEISTITLSNTFRNASVNLNAAPVVFVDPEGTEALTYRPKSVKKVRGISG